MIAKSANLALSFFLELCMLAALGYWGFTTGGEFVTRITLGIGAPLLAAVVWGIFLAPASSRRLAQPFRLVLELAIFGLAIIALYAAGQPAWALIFGIVYVINKVLQFVWHQ
jgi:hypothetical protein